MIQLQCIDCKRSYPLNEVRYHCDCGHLLAVDYGVLSPRQGLQDTFDARLSTNAGLDASGVWRFREFLPPIEETNVVSHPEGSTRLYLRESLQKFAGMEGVWFKHEGENPTGSFKDRGMTVAVSMAKMLGFSRIACASTGNTSASLASYAAHAGLKSVVLLPSGQVASGKLAQALGYGATCLAVDGDFDDAMRLVQKSAGDLGMYLVNSVNPFRLEGQKTIIWEMLQQRQWRSPDWVVVPAGNLGNTSAFGKAINEAYALGLIAKKPRLASIQASGANPFFLSFQGGLHDFHATKAKTIATAIQIGNPVNFEKARRCIRDLDGVVAQVTDEQILEAKAAIDACGIGCEPASAASLAGIRQLVSEGAIKKHEEVVGILTGHMLKDADVIVNSPSTRGSLSQVKASLSEIERHLK